VCVERPIPQGVCAQPLLPELSTVARDSLIICHSSKCNGEQLRYFCVVSSLQWLFSGTSTYFCVVSSLQRLFIVRGNVFLHNYLHSLYCGILTNVALLQSSSGYCSDTLLIHAVVNIFALIQGKVSLFLLLFIKIILYTLLLLLVQHTTN